MKERRKEEMIEGRGKEGVKEGRKGYNEQKIIIKKRSELWSKWVLQYKKTG